MYLGHGVDPLLDLGVCAPLLGRVQRQQLREGLADHGLVELNIRNFLSAHKSSTTKFLSFNSCSAT